MSTTAEKGPPVNATAQKPRAKKAPPLTHEVFDFETATPHNVAAGSPEDAARKVAEQLNIEGKPELSVYILGGAVYRVGERRLRVQKLDPHEVAGKTWKPKRLTADALRDLDACAEWYRKFTKIFPSGLLLDAEGIERALLAGFAPVLGWAKERGFVPRATMPAIEAEAYLRGADLTGAYLRGADLRGAYLRGADLRGAYLRGADLTGAYLRGADLRGADLTGAYLRGADLTNHWSYGKTIIEGAKGLPLIGRECLEERGYAYNESTGLWAPKAEA